jgi:hypothetical protein
VRKRFVLVEKRGELSPLFGRGRRFTRECAREVRVENYDSEALRELHLARYSNIDLYGINNDQKFT